MLRYFFLLLLSFQLIACGGGNSDQTTSLEFDPFADQFNPLANNIGFYPLYSYRRDAALLAIQQINALGGILQKPLNLVTVHVRTVDASNVIDLVETTRRMVSDYKIPVVGVGFSSATVEITPTMVEYKAVLIGDSATSPSITTLADDDFVFRIPPSDKIGSQLFAQLAKDKNANECITIHVENDVYGEGLTTAFSQAFTALGGKIITNVIIPQDITTGFSPFFPQIFNINGTPPDCIFPVLLQSTTTANFINEASSVAFSGFYLLSDAAVAQGFAESIANTEQLKGSIVITPGFGPRESPEYTYFVDTYFAQYQLEPLNYAVHSYDFIMTAALAMERAGYYHQTHQPTGEMIRDSLRKIANPSGELVGPSQIAQALALLRAGKEINYSGASNPEFGWDTNGDVTGIIAYDLFRYDSLSGQFERSEQIKQNIALE